MTTTNTSFADLPSSRTPEYIPVGIPGLLAATQKALGMNRGEMEEDQRDGQQFKRIYEAPDLMAERIKLDTGRIQRTALRHAARHRSLKGLMPGAFTPLVEKHLVSNQLSSPLEEINPLDLMNQNLRVTLMGPGGIGSMDAVTGSMQAIHPSSFGFLSAIEGPECFDEKTEVYTRRGWVKWPDARETDVFACRISGRLEWHKAERLIAETYCGPMFVAESKTLRMQVTPSHRVLHNYKSGGRELIKSASGVAGKAIRMPARHLPYIGIDSMRTFELPALEKISKYSNQKKIAPFDISDWCEFMGWWLSEGSLFVGKRKDGHDIQRVGIAQDPSANPENCRRISALFRRMNLSGSSGNGAEFVVTLKQFVEYFKKWEHGCLDKFIPEELFAAPLRARQCMFDALIRGDGTQTSKTLKYCTVSERLAKSVELLAVGLGYSAYTKVVGLTRRKEAEGRPYYNVRVIRRASCTAAPAHWSSVEYSGMVYCATVPGGLLLVRGKPGTAGFWSGNSSLAGIDTRISNGARIGSNGRIYQQFRNRRTGDIHWLSSPDLANSVVALPQS